MKNFSETEKSLRKEVLDIQRKDENLITMSETAMCFGEVHFS